MAYEIERKFLVTSDAWRTDVIIRKHLCQFYLSVSGPSSVRVRISDNANARLTIKSVEAGMRRSEFEYAIPLDDAESMRSLAVGSIIEKTRHIVPAGDLHWEIDEFEGPNHGLVIAEIELPSVGHSIEHPNWLGEEITDNRRYYNAALALRPFKTW